ncbi:MAG TPA: hypothetical protein PKK06_10095 [Phycisphaerae bacterium]|nr:hypothetical protein [Phycisphaerae bacterium]HNU45623.1 hypothetical protein [Phycisphaerae bacterium]
MDAVPEPKSKPAELQRALGIDFKLAWRIIKVIGAHGPLAAGPHVPGPGALRTFLSAARKAGVQGRLVDAAASAAADFDQLVASHAGDRTAFDSMISSLATTEDARQITLQHRRAAFRAQSHILGVQTRVQLKCVVVQPALDPNRLDLVRISGLLSLRQLRPNAPLIVPRISLVNDDGSVNDGYREPLDPSCDPSSGVMLLNDFCSQPPPRFQPAPPELGPEYGELVSQGLGKGAAITFIGGHLVRSAVPRYRDEQNPIGANFVRVRIPSEVLLIDLLIHEDTYGVLAPVSRTRAEHFGELPYLRILDETHQLGPHAPVDHLGKGCSVLYTPDVPGYAELGRYVFERLGSDPEHFDLYRCRIEYPVLPSTVAVAFELPVAPESAAG